MFSGVVEDTGPQPSPPRPPAQPSMPLSPALRTPQPLWSFSLVLSILPRGFCTELHFESVFLILHTSPKLSSCPFQGSALLS